MVGGGGSGKCRIYCPAFMECWFGCGLNGTIVLPTAQAIQKEV